MSISIADDRHGLGPLLMGKTVPRFNLPRHSGQQEGRPGRPRHRRLCGTGEDIAAGLPPSSDSKETQKAIFHLKRYIEDNLCKELGLMMVEVPLIVDAESGVNDMLDRDGSRTPIQFHISNDRDMIPSTPRSYRPPPNGKRRPQAVRLPPRRRHLHRHAGCPQRLLP